MTEPIVAGFPGLSLGLVGLAVPGERVFELVVSMCEQQSVEPGNDELRDS